MTNVLLVGNGAREHALAYALKKNPDVNLFAVLSSRNPGIVPLCREAAFCRYDDFDAISEFLDGKDICYAVIGPEDPLEKGIVDFLEGKGIPCVGPKKKLAQLESSKSFTRNLLTKHGIPFNPAFRVFVKYDEKALMEYMSSLRKCVVKADGLCGGKGVLVQDDHFSLPEEALSFCRESISKFGRIVVEEKLLGQEFSLISLCDGKHLKHTIPVQDNKRAFNDDKGPNTGGMGTYSSADHLLPFLKKEHVDAACRCNEMTAEALHKEFGEYYKGVIYGGFILTKDGVKLIEYNSRFGDPEGENLMWLLKSDLHAVFSALVEGKLDAADFSFEKKASVLKYVVPEGYPAASVKNETVDVSGVEESKDLKLFYAAVDENDGKLIMTGSRAIAVTAKADTVEKAEKLCEDAVSKIKGRVFHRSDIGTKAMIEKKVRMMKEILG